MKLIIHAGLHRTGSTALQQWLAANQPRLAREGILANPGALAPELGLLVQSAADAFGAEAAVDTLTGVVRALGRNYDAMILSDENFTGRMPAPGRDFFGALGHLSTVLALLAREHSVRPLLVLREHGSWLQSVHRFVSVRAKSAAGFAAFADRLALDQLSFRKLAETLAAAAGPQSLMVEDYAMLAADGGKGLLARMLAAAGAGPGAADVLPRSNVSLPEGMRGLAVLLEPLGLAPSQKAVPLLADALETGCHGDAAGLEALAGMIRQSAFPVRDGLKLKERLRAANAAFKTGTDERPLTPAQARRIAADLAALQAGESADAAALAMIRMRMAEDRRWVARHLLPGWSEAAAAVPVGA